MSTSNTKDASKGDSASSTFVQKTGLAKMLKGGVIMDVVNADQVSLLSQLYLQLNYNSSFSSHPSIIY